MERHRAGGMSVTMETAMKKLAETHKPRIMVIEAGSTFADNSKQLDGYQIEITNDGISIVGDK